MLPVPSEMTAAVGGILTAAQWNSNVRDAVDFLANPPLFIGYGSTPQAVATSVFVDVALDTNVVDTYGGHSTTSNNSRYVAQVAGYYDLVGQIGYPSNGTGVRSARFYVNGAVPTLEPLFQIPASASGGTDMQVSGCVYLNAGDYVELEAWQNSGSSLSLSASVSWLTVRWVHA